MNLPRGRPFPPGNSGGPGRPKGSRNQITRAQRLLDQYAESIMRKCIFDALKGDPTSKRLCIERIMPVRREAYVRLKKLLPVETLNDVKAASNLVWKAVSSGQITPAEAEAMSTFLEKLRKTIEVTDLETRLEQLEGKIGSKEQAASREVGGGNRSVAD